MFNFLLSYSQVVNHQFNVGLKSGVGKEFENSNYSFTNKYYKIEIDYLLKKYTSISFEIVVQPEINFGTHQLLNFYFVQPEEADYEAKRAEFTQLKNFNQYILNVGFLARKKLFKQLTIFALASVGPMISDVETERLSKGFAFSDVFTLGLSYSFKRIRLDISPSVRHVSNAGLQYSNAGFNTKNIEFGLVHEF
ncbi:acyloxyacyl hydrolase [Flavobacterium sp.]|uniref:acyloxyacyl hydrolase n=1 Tax=Flavobacterium sp. TaxID=239 RepID=UPI003C526861